MENKQNKLISVTDLSSYLFCPRKFFLERVKGLKQPPNKAMIEGRIRHNVLESFSNKEQELVSGFEEQKTKHEIIQAYEKLLQGIIADMFAYEFELIKKFRIEPNLFADKIRESMKNDIHLRSDSIESAMKRGFFGSALWDNLSPKYLSEFAVTSEKLGLKGRVDRVMISDVIVPFELKTREIQQVYPSDEIQLAAYVMLLEEKFQKQIPFGILESGNKKHQVPITRELKQKVLNLIEEIKELYTKDSARFPSNFSKCQTCSLQEDCEEL